MKIWRIAPPPESEYARAGVPGHQLKDLDSAASLLIEWRSGFDRVGDFTLTGVEEIVVTEQVAREICAAFGHLSLRPVTMTQEAKLKKPHRVTKRTTPRVWLPYDGPPLVNLRAEAIVDADPRRWPVVRNKAGDYYKVEGTEEFYNGFFEVFWPRLSTRRIRRNRREGFFFAEDVLHGIDIFRVRDQGIRLPDGSFDVRESSIAVDSLGWVFCTDRAKNFIEQEGYSNVTFLEMGETYVP